MVDSFSETTSTSWFTRIKNALSGIVVGILLVIASVGFLFWNEGRAVKTATALAEGAGLVQTVDPNSMPSEMTGKLVHFSGDLIPAGIVEDGLFTGIAAPQGALRLVRKVEMYQWEESSESKTVKKLGGGEEKTTTYTYEKKWSDKKIDSSSFKEPSGHANPEMSINSQTFSVASGTVGKVTLAGGDVSHLGKEQAVAPTEQLRSIVEKRFSNGQKTVINGQAIEVRSNLDNSSVGDLRISFSIGDADTISVIGKFENSTIIPFTTSNGRNISMFREGAADAKQMFDDAVSSNTMWTWAIRFGGFLAMMLGFNMIFSIVGVLGDVVPFIGDVFRFATGMAAFALASVLSTLIIGIAWIYFRPVIGILIIVAGIIFAAAAIYIGKSKARQRKLETSAPLAA